MLDGPPRLWNHCLVRMDGLEYNHWSILPTNLAYNGLTKKGIEPDDEMDLAD